MDKKRTAIITWISYLNFGTYLQAYALQTIVRSLGYENAIISDERIVRSLHERRSRFKKLLAKIYHYLRDDFRIQKGMKRIRYSYDFFASNHLLIDNNWKSFIELDKKYDLYICGSDQIWSSILPKEPYYYAAFTNKKKIAYAPSIGQKYCSSEWLEWAKPLINKFSHISVREEEGACLLNKIVDKPIHVVLDPTLLLSSEDWIRLLPEHSTRVKPYVLCYLLTYNPTYLNFIRNFAKKKGLLLKIFMLDKRYFSYADEPLFAGPLEFLSEINGSIYFFTDSFHGSIFAIQFEKRFYTLKRFKETAVNNQNSRIENLFRKLGMEDYFIGDENLAIIDKLQDVDYALVKRRLSQEREESLKYLINSLKA